MDKLIPKETSKGAEEIVLTQIKQDFITPANAIFDYVDMVEKVLDEADLQSDDEIEQIKSSCSKLIEQYEVAFVQNTGANADSSKKSPEEYSELRHNLRTPLNAIIGYSEILMEDYEDDLEEGTLEDFQQIINLARETETAIENFVDYIRGEAIDPNNDNSSNQLESAEALFKSLGDIEYSISLGDEIKESDILIVDDNVTNCEVLQRRLSMQGLTCRTAYDGNTALSEVFKKTPDLILLDVILPDINGLELLNSDLPKELILSREKDELLNIFKNIVPINLQNKCKWVSEMNKKKQSLVFGLEDKKLKMALNRKYTIPFVFEGSKKQRNELSKIIKNEDLYLQEGGRVINLTDRVSKAKALQIFVRFLKKNNKNIKTIAVGDNYNDLEMLKKSDFPCLVFNDKFTLNEIPINNLITTNKPSPGGWADVIKMALVKINKN